VTVYCENEYSEQIESYEPNEYIAVEIKYNMLGPYINKRGLHKIINEDIADMDIDQNLEKFIKSKGDNNCVIGEHMNILNEYALYENRDIIIASNGSATDDNKGAYGVVVASGNIIAIETNSRIPTIHGKIDSH
jgi:hypothetical protein